MLNLKLNGKQIATLQVIADESERTVENIAENIIAEYIAMYNRSSVVPNFKSTKMIDLPIGTRFWVRNGSWSGEIININGYKHIQVEEKHFFLIENDYELSIDLI